MEMKVTKIVYNRCYGGFGLSKAAWERYVELGGQAESSFDLDRNRTDPILVQVVEELGEDANGMCADLVIDDLPAGTKYRIEEYDGLEHIETEDSIKWSVA
jgi:hypothetical protein